MTGRWLLLLAAAVLLGTAAYHASGTLEVRAWLTGRRADLLVLLWLSPAVSWAVTALVLVQAGLRGDRRAAPIIVLLTLAPASTALGLGLIYGWAFLGVWLLATTSALMIAGAARLPRPEKAKAPLA